MLTLEKFNKDLYYKIITWNLDSDIQNKLGQPTEDPQEIVRTVQDWLGRKDIIIFGLKLKDELIGYALLINLDFANKQVCYHLVIGKKSLWNKGYGIKATDLIKDFVFKKLELHRIHTYTIGWNNKINKILIGLGFKAEGVLRESFLHKGKFKNVVVYGLLKKE